MTRASPQRIKARILAGPINRTLIASGIFAAAMAVSAPGKKSDYAQYVLHYGAGFVAAILALRAASYLVQDYRLRRDVAISQLITDDHGSAREATPGERTARGMDDWRNGELFGLDENGAPVWRPKNAPFSLVIIPPGGFKTIALVIPSILHRAMLGFSVFVPDVKLELAVMLIAALRAFRFKVLCINPSGKFLRLVGNTPINVYQPFLDALYGDAEARKDAVKLANDYATLHYPMKNEDKPYFGFGSRRALSLGLMIIGLFFPDSCTPTELYLLLTDPERFLRLAKEMADDFEGLPGQEAIVEVAKAEARNLLHAAADLKENFAAFLEGASQRLTNFNPSGHLGHYGREATHKLDVVREEAVIVFVMTPLSHMREMADFVSLINYNLIAACKAKPDGHPLHIVGEEALNYRNDNLVSDWETMRQLGVTADLYLQSTAGIERHYGKDAAAALDAMADIKVYSGVSSFAEAKHVSDMLASSTIRTQDYAFGASVREVNVSSRETARPLMTADEVLAMEKGTAWMFVRGMHPVRIRLINYAQVTPWTNWVAPSPISGTRVVGTPLLHVDYENGR